MKDTIQFLDVDISNVTEHGIFCIKNKKNAGYQKKLAWFKERFNAGLKIKIACDIDGKQLGFVEYIPAELAWRPIKAENYFFIQCIALFVKDAQHKKIGSKLIALVEEDAKASAKAGVCTVTSDGSWMASKSVFEKNGYTIAEQKERFELMCKKLDEENPNPSFNDWRENLKKYKGWNLVYSDQCPMHEKSINDIKESALKHNIDLNISKLAHPKEAQQAPSGFATYCLIKDGVLIEDHYISKTRFENILKKMA